MVKLSAQLGLSLAQLILNHWVSYTMISFNLSTHFMFCGFCSSTFFKMKEKNREGKGRGGKRRKVEGGSALTSSMMMHPPS